MKTMRSLRSENNKLGSCKPSLTATLGFYGVLTFGISSVALAEDLTSDLMSGSGRQALQTYIDTADLNGSNRAWLNNTSIITQIGNDNLASVTQSRNTAEFAFGNYAKIYQNGNENEANIIQTGGNNIGLIGQIGDSHQASIEQHGNSFEAQVNQAGYNSDVAISQSGSGLRSISVGQNSPSGMATPVTIRTY